MDQGFDVTSNDSDRTPGLYVDDLEFSLRQRKVPKVSSTVRDLGLRKIGQRWAQCPMLRGGKEVLVGLVGILRHVATKM